MLGTGAFHPYIPHVVIDYIWHWYRQNFSNPQVVILVLLLVLGTTVILLFGKILAPVIASVVIAYVLEGVVDKMVRRGANRRVAVLLVFGLFMVGLIFALTALLPLVYRQVVNLLDNIPAIVAQTQTLLMQLPERYPALFSEEQVTDLVNAIRTETTNFAGRATEYALNIAPVLFVLIIYLVLMPLLVYFFMMDKEKILAWFGSYLPKDRELVARVWRESNQQIANYIQGKFWEIVIVGLVTYITFAFLGLEYAALLGLFTGLSVLIPYIGATVVTFPVAIIAYVQWGWGPELITVMIAYGVIQALDANVLVPVLFSKVVNLHPVAIIVAVLFFGGIWGFWGVFFAIPLATVIKAVLSAWPRATELARQEKEEQRQDAEARAADRL